MMIKSAFKSRYFQKVDSSNAQASGKVEKPLLFFSISPHFSIFLFLTALTQRCQSSLL
ncbi:hypothetical protein [uncultured Helicobacter sp.]|uniref:hypothetical protein n=1 Tax=uncultured Helicobacter sp. TaxID=175537 RepID=UPI002638B098|nr:hypothetical protein [uncultured Helicobacter sp.]